MKINISIKADSNVSYYCGGWLVSREPFQIKLGNQAIANLVSGPMPCRVEIPGMEILDGSIRKSGNNGFFIIRQ